MIERNIRSIDASNLGDLPNLLLQASNGNIEDLKILLSDLVSYLQGGNVITPDNSAAWQVNSVTKGILPPRMTTTQKGNISSPAEGLIVYDTSLHALCVYNGTDWKTVTVS